MEKLVEGEWSPHPNLLAHRMTRTRTFVSEDTWREKKKVRCMSSALPNDALIDTRLTCECVIVVVYPDNIRLYQMFTVDGP